jgi:hypothetical protein
MLNNSNAVRFLNTFLKVEHVNSPSERDHLDWILVKLLMVR